MNAWQLFTLVFKTLCFIYLFCFHLAEQASETAESANLNTVEKWKLIDHKVNEISDFVIDRISSLMIKNRNNLNVTLKCARESFKLFKSIRNRELWAIKFIESGSKIIDALMGGTTSSLGAYDGCLDIKVASKKTFDRNRFTGQYCLIHLTPPILSEDGLQELLGISMKNSEANFEFRSIVAIITEYQKVMDIKDASLIRFGVCVPSGCSEEDVRKISNTITEKFYLNTRVQCGVKRSNEYSTTQILTLSYYVIIGLLVLIGTFFDIYCRYTNTSSSSKMSRTLLGLSFVFNSKKIFDTEDEAGTFRCIHGIRVITCCWIVLPHVLLHQIIPLMYNPWPKFKDITEDLAFQITVVHMFQVDTFFFLSGFLAAYQNLKGKNSFSILYYAGNRIFRILPTYISIITFLSIVNLLGSGPMWQTVNADLQIENCSRTWWRNLLFINNFYQFGKMCLTHTWYLSADFQLYMASLIIILPLLRWPSIGIMIGAFAILLSMIYSGVIVYIHNLIPVNIYHVHYMKYWNNSMNHYSQPFMHAGIFCIGVLTAKFFINNQKMKLSKKIQVIGWIFAIIPNIVLQYYPVVWNRGGIASLSSFISYAVFGRTCWGVGLAWVIVCCGTGNGGIVNTILSWKAFIPFSRLTFTAYLIHPIAQHLYLGSSRTMVALSYLSLVWLYLAVMFVTFLAAFGMSAIIEMPFLNVRNIVLPRKVSERKSIKLNQLDLAAKKFNIK